MSNRATFGRSGTVVADVIDGLGPWADGNGPLFRKLARAFAAGIERGSFAPDARLPSERVLADALAIGRGTAVAAYDELVADGLLERRRGSGTFVAVDRPHLPYGREGSALVHRLVERSEPDGEVVDLSLSVLRDAHGVPSVSVRTADLAGVVPDTGYTPWGLAPLRRGIAALVTEWGLPSDEHEIVVTTGAQQAISLAAVCWLRPGDVVVVDDPTYPGALAAFRQAGATVVGVPLDERGAGVDAAALSAALRRRPAAVYLQPTLNSPTGAITSGARRREIARLLDEARVPLIEDMALAGLAWQSSPPPIASMVRSTSAAVIGSLGKLFWGGLRVGFVRAPAPLALRFARIKATHDLGSSAVTQLLAARMLASPAAASFGPQRVAELRARYDVLAGLLRRHLPAWSFKAPSGGLSLWVKLPTGGAEAFAQHALRHGAAVAAPGALSPAPAAFADRVRLSFSGTADELEEGVRRLAAAWGHSKS